MSSKYYVYYRELCLVKVREFTYYVDMQDWLAAYLIKHQDNDDYGVDAVFKGSVQYITDSIPVEGCKKAKAVTDDECDLSIEGVSVEGGYDGTHFP